MITKASCGWNPNLSDGTLTLLQVLYGHFSFFISICSKVRVFLFWTVDAAPCHATHFILLLVWACWMFGVAWGSNAFGWHGTQMHCHPMLPQCVAARVITDIVILAR